MLVIRLQRTGRKHDPHFRVVVCEHTIGPKAGKYLEKIGSYNPKTKERLLDEERINYWMSQGAKPSDTMHNLLVTAGVLKKPKINVLPKRKILAKRLTASNLPARSAQAGAQAGEQEKKDATDKAAAEAAKNAPKAEPAAEAPAAEAPAEVPAEEPKSE